MTIQITKKITGYSVARPDEPAPADTAKQIGRAHV